MSTERAFKALCKVAAAARPPIYSARNTPSSASDAAQPRTPAARRPIARPAKPAKRATNQQTKARDGYQVDYNAPLEKRQRQADWINQTGEPLPPDLR